MGAMKKARPDLAQNQKAMDCIKMVVDRHFLGDDGKGTTECRAPRTGTFKPTPPRTGGRVRR
jgi:hypothetical protein